MTAWRRGVSGWPGCAAAGPVLGQHTEQVLEQVLGIDADACAALADQGVLGTAGK